MEKQEIRDASGRLIGTVVQEGRYLVARTASRQIVGRFDGKTTRRTSGQLVGSGNLLATLLR
jgi:hypothetical protein